jgi:signal transduction histidine kinase/CheY-like chemotaxis protein
LEQKVKSSAAKYVLIVGLILVVFGVASKIYINFSKLPNSKSVNKILEFKNDFNLIDSCIYTLYNAENSFRLYVVNGDKTYYKQFVEQIKQVSVTMDSIRRQGELEEPINAESFNTLIAQKKLRAAQFIKLKKLADSLMDFTRKNGIDLPQINSNNKVFSARQFKSIIRVDTLRKAVIAEPKKKFFGRLVDAFSDKSKKGSDSSVSSIIKTTLRDDTSTASIAYNKAQLKEINNFYTQFYKTNTAAKLKENELLDLNHRLILNVLYHLKQYKAKENKYYTEIQKIVNLSSIDVLKNIDSLTVLLIVLLVALLVFIFYTIYQLYRGEKALINHSNKASLYALSKSRFLANMSHEIRTPLNSIVGFSEQLNQDNLNIEQKDHLAAIRSSSVMLLDVVNDILDFSKYETGKVTLEKVAFSPNVAIDDVFNNMKILAEKKKIALNLEMGISDNIYLLGDPLRLKQVVMNLVSNAIKFTKKGFVTIKVNFDNGLGKNGSLKVSVADTGVGINETDQRIIFDEFAQVYYASTKERQQGTGLGLAICKKIIDFQGGNISVVSEPGVGSTFAFELPYDVIEKSADLVIDTEIDDDKKILSGKKVLLADDNMLNILLASTILKKYNIKYDSVYNGKEALELFKERDYDIVLTDIQMPEMGGVELTRLIRGLPDVRKANIPVLGVTANVMKEDREKYLNSGMNELVLKPFLEKELIDKIISFL